MKILIIDRDEISSQLIASRLKNSGHELIMEVSREKAIELLKEGNDVDVVLFDPSPLTATASVVLSIRRVTGSSVYLVMMTKLSDDMPTIGGLNDAIEKPCDPVKLEKVVDNARVFLEIYNRIGDESEDFPSAGGVIAKSAFNQLFRSSIERADRYGEKASLLFIGIDNYNDILEHDGQYAADYVASTLARELVMIRRQSDVIGQTGKGEYALLLQSPRKENEAVEAAKRFAQSLGEIKSLAEGGAKRVVVSVKLVSIPSGDVTSRYEVEITNNAV